MPRRLLQFVTSNTMHWPAGWKLATCILKGCTAGRSNYLSPGMIYSTEYTCRRGEAWLQTSQGQHAWSQPVATQPARQSLSAMCMQGTPSLAWLQQALSKLAVKRPASMVSVQHRGCTSMLLKEHAAFGPPKHILLTEHAAFGAS